MHQSITQLKNMPEEKRNKIRCLKGHMPFGLHKYLLNSSVYLTVLREPIERVISHYYFV